MADFRVELEVIEMSGGGQRFAFAGHETFLVGRSAKAHLRLDEGDKLVSRHHFLVEINPPRCRLIDLKSNNGTFVNGVRVSTAELKDGDEIRAGQAWLRVSIAADEATVTHQDAIVDLSEAETKILDEATAGVPGYEIVRELGRGGMGVVYLARRTADGGEAALKMVHPAGNASRTQIARFLREASILGQLDHPNIVRFREMGEASGRPYFVMDYVPGANAGQLLKDQGPLPVKLAVRIVGQVLRGLEHAHERRFVHRDIKPANILIGAGDGKKVVKLADFGLARVYQASQLSGLTVSGDIGGTVSYLPPEQITNYRDVSPAADQYSAAATLYYLLTGKPVYDFATSPMQPLVLILQEDPVPIQTRRPDLPDDLAETIHRALMREPRHRFADVAAFRAELLTFAR